jgi:beta-ketoacyl-acyl-carrier-protein synthase II
MITSLGLDKQSSFENICNGKTGVDKISLFDASEFPVQIAAEVKGFDPSSIIEDGKEIKKMDRFIQLGLKAAGEAIEDAKFSGFDSDEFGVSSASGIGGLPNIEINANTCLQRGPRRISPFFIPSALVNMLGGFVSIYYKLKGPNLSSVTACAASAHAIMDAARVIMIGEAKKMLAVGAEAAVCPVGIGGFAAMKALCARNDDPAHASRPFDAERNGFVMGEGAAALVLEELEDAKARGAKIYGELVGFGASGDAYHITSPSLDGPIRAMKKAYEMAGRPKIDYINAHGTSTAINDKNETAALKELFGEGKVPAVSSTKGQLGHCLGATGAVEAAISLLAMQNGIIPPTINQISKDPDCDLDYVPNVARKAKLDCVMSNNFGFGGTNASLIFKRVD